MSRPAKAALAAFLGLALALSLLELGLWIAHAVSLRANGSGGDGRPVILCVGNSITKGDGAPPGESYPELLEKELAAQGRSYRVVNAGVSNATTALLLRRLPAQLAELRPQIVTLMVGDPNYWFGFGRATFLARAGRGGSLTIWKARFETVLYSLRTVNWLRLLFSRPQHTTPKRTPQQWLGFLTAVSYNTEWAMPQTLAEAKTEFERYRKQNPGDVELALALAGIAIRQGDWEPAEARLKEARALAPGRYFLLFDFMVESLIAKAPPQEARKWAKVQRLLAMDRPPEKFRQALISFHFLNHDLQYPAFPREVRGKDRCAYIDKLLSYAPLDVSRHVVSYRCHKENGDAEAAVDSLVGAMERLPFSLHIPRVRRALAEDRKKQNRLGQLLNARLDAIGRKHGVTKAVAGLDTAAWVRSDLQEMIRLIQASGAKVLLQAYPPLRDQSYRAIDELVPRFAAELKIPFSDTQASVRSLNLRGEAWQELFTSAFGPTDSHLSGKGNSLVARTLLHALEEQRWLTAP